MNANDIINIVLIILAFTAIILGFLLFVTKNSDKKAKNSKKEEKNDKNRKNESEATKFATGLTKESILNFIDFDEVKDNMIIRKKGEQYIMVIQCQGVNYDLLSEEEKIAVEEGFVQFLNVLRYPIQLYVQTRSLNLRDIIDEYKKMVKVAEEDLEQISIKLRDANLKKNEQLIKELKFQEKRKRNILEYTADITDYVGRLSLNKNVLQQKTYVIISYFAKELGSVDTYSKEEIDNLCFSELYTRCQTVIRSLATSGVNGRVLDSEELAELLYIAYNRDDEELIQLERALDAEYDSLYNVGKDVLEKKKEQIIHKMEQEAATLASESLIETDKILKEKREKILRSEKIKKKALSFIDQYRNDMSDELYTGTKKRILTKVNEEQEKIIGTKNQKLTEKEIEKLTKRKISGRKTL